jgi:hypothetical protein
MPDPTPTPKTSTTSDFNITLALGKAPGTPVTIFAQDLAAIETNGLHFKLPDGTSVDIGSLSDFISWLNSTFTAGLPTTAGTDWPDIIKNIFNGLLAVKISVTQLTFDQAAKGTDGKWPNPEFSISVTGTAGSPVTIVSGFQIVGGGVGITRTNTSS